MEEQEKRERKKNFPVDECQILTEEFEANKEVLESKLTNTVTNKRKNDTWKDITLKVNSLGYGNRTVEEVKEESGEIFVFMQKGYGTHTSQAGGSK